MKKKIKSKYEEMEKLHDEAIRKFCDRYDDLVFKVFENFVAYNGKPKKKK